MSEPLSDKLIEQIKEFVKSLSSNQFIESRTLKAKEYEIRMAIKGFVLEARKNQDADPSGDMAAELPAVYPPSSEKRSD